MKTVELTGRALDYAVALAEGWELLEVPPDADGLNAGRTLRAPAVAGMLERREYTWPPKGKVSLSGAVPRYTSMSAGDDIIDREKIGTEWLWNIDEPCWQARIYQHSLKHSNHADGTTRREAAMRAYVLSKLGEEVDIPEELQ